MAEAVSSIADLIDIRASHLRLLPYNAATRKKKIILTIGTIRRKPPLYIQTNVEVKAGIFWTLRTSHGTTSTPDNWTVCALEVCWAAFIE